MLNMFQTDIQIIIFIIYQSLESKYTTVSIKINFILCKNSEIKTHFSLILNMYIQFP